LAAAGASGRWSQFVHEEVQQPGGLLVLLRLAGGKCDSSESHHHVERGGIRPDRPVGGAGLEQFRERA
jgi:hypothetical protein